MKSLFSLSFNVLVSSPQAHSREFLPPVLKEEYYRREAQVLCGSVVRERIAAEESVEEDPWIGYMEGIHYNNQRRYFDASNALCKEEYVKRGIYNAGVITSPMMIYYLKQEPWFKKEYIGPGPNRLLKYVPKFDL